MSGGGRTESREIVDGTRSERCDNCVHWKPLSPGRIMGWCQDQAEYPVGVPALAIILGRADEMTAYNQRCAAFASRPDTQEVR